MPATRVTIRTKRRFGNTDSIIKAVESNANAAAYNYSRAVVSSARRRVHVITGTLRNSIHRVKVAPGHHKVIVGAHYGAYEEYGTRYRPPHPYLRPAVEDARRGFLMDMKNVFRPVKGQLVPPEVSNR